MTKRVIGFLLALVMVFGILPMNILAAERDDSKAQVRVIVENTTFTEPVDGVEPAWTGTLVDSWVDLQADSTMMTCVVAALDEIGATQQGAESNYISEVNGLAAFDGGSASGWMGTLNDWFTNEGFGAFTVESGKLSAGDEIRIMYTRSYGEDLGGSWGNSDTSLKDLTFSDGTLEPAFDGAVLAYTLTVPADVSAVQITPTAANKNFQVHTKIGEQEYKRTAFVPVTDGTVITVECGTGPSMNAGATPTVYTVQVAAAVDTRAAEAVVALIAKIGEPKDSALEITAARKAYDALPEEQKAYVTNYDILTAAEQALRELPHADFGKMFAETGAVIAASDLQFGNEWLAIGLARSDREVSNAYYESAADYVAQKINDKGQLHRVKSTDNSRVILALTAIGRDVTDVAGHDLLQGLSDLDYLEKQGNNGPIWALIALDSHAYEIPAVFEGGRQTTRQALIDYILNVQLPDGGWTLFNSPDATADADMTGMALQALAPYYGENEAVTAAVDSALETVSGLQLANGGFASWGTVNVESADQILVALTALGIDTETDERFIKNGRTILDFLSEFYVDGGGFVHITDQTAPDAMATEQTYYALTAYARLAAGRTALYDMTDAVILPFGDIATNAWYRQDVKAVLDGGIMQGTARDAFSPYASLTRGQLMVTLYRLSGRPAVEGKLPFTDVDASRYDADAILWAQQNGIAKGLSATVFQPNAPIDRAQLAAFLMRYAAFSKADTDQRAALDSFKDAAEVPAYAAEAMAWAVEEGLLNGIREEELAPRAEATRCQFAAVMNRFCALIAG